MCTRVASCHTWMSSCTLNSQQQQLDSGTGRAGCAAPRQSSVYPPGEPFCLLPDGKEQHRPQGRGKYPRAIRPNPRLGLRLEMAAAEPGSSGTPARRARLLSASPMLPRDCDPGALAQPAESWGPRAPGTPSPAQLREMVLTQVRPLGVEGEKLTDVVGVMGESRFCSVCQVGCALPLAS